MPILVIELPNTGLNITIGQCGGAKNQILFTMKLKIETKMLYLPNVIPL